MSPLVRDMPTYSINAYFNRTLRIYVGRRNLGHKTTNYSARVGHRVNLVHLRYAPELVLFGAKVIRVHLLQLPCFPKKFSLRMHCVTPVRAFVLDTASCRFERLAFSLSDAPLLPMLLENLEKQTIIRLWSFL